MVTRVRSLSIALLIVLVASAVSGQQPKREREPYIAPLLPAEQAWKITLAARIERSNRTYDVSRSASRSELQVITR